MKFETETAFCARTYFHETISRSNYRVKIVAIVDRNHERLITLSFGCYLRCSSPELWLIVGVWHLFNSGRRADRSPSTDGVCSPHVMWVLWRVYCCFFHQHCNPFAIRFLCKYALHTSAATPISIHSGETSRVRLRIPRQRVIKQPWCRFFIRRQITRTVLLITYFCLIRPIIKPPVRWP